MQTEPQFPVEPADGKVIMSPTEPKITVSETDRTVQRELAHFQNDPDLLERLEASDILIVPMRGYMGYDQPVFPKPTRDLYRYLRSQADLAAEVAATEDEYRELSRRADEFTLPIIILAEPVAQLTISILGNYIFERLRGRLSDSTVNATIIVEDDDDDISAVIEYEGPPEQFEETVSAVFAERSD